MKFEITINKKPKKESINDKLGKTEKFLEEA
jgi:hypothetical protein